VTKIKLTIHKEISSDLGKTTWGVTMKVVNAEGITPNVFVMQYAPGSRYTGPAVSSFSNVAYLDELYSIPDTVSNSHKPCMYRSSGFTCWFSCKEDCEAFIREVEDYTKRLISHLEDGLLTDAATDITISADSAESVICTGHATTDLTTDTIHLEDAQDVPQPKQEEPEVSIVSINANGD
jgi:hypothetical protein